MLSVRKLTVSPRGARVHAQGLEIDGVVVCFFFWGGGGEGGLALGLRAI